MQNRNRGFTLIELMIAVAILAIVATIAIPAYNRYSQRTYRAEAQADLLACAQALERYAAQNFNYSGADTPFAAGTLCSPTSAEQGRYAFTLGNLGANTFTLTATPDENGPMKDDGTLTYDQAGRRTWAGSDGW